MDFLKNFYNIVTKDKKSITLFTTLVNIKCLAYYIFSRVLFGNAKATSFIFANQHFVSATILAIIDLLFCWGYVHSCVKIKTNNEDDSTEDISLALGTAKFLAELQQGNIVSSGMYSFDYVTKIEQDSTKDDEIWCITGDLEEDSNNHDLGNVINENLKKGVIYKYFITHLGETISSKASLGRQRLQETNSAYKKRLKFIEINEELVAPDIDIIIYKANHINERIGFVCVEIGDDQNTYIYQQMSQTTLQGIFDILVSYNNRSKKRKRIFQTFLRWGHNVMSYFVKHLSIGYFLLSAGGLTLLSFSKIVSWISAILFLIPAIIEFFITSALMVTITGADLTYKEALCKSSENVNMLASIINSQQIQSVTEDLKRNNLNKLMDQKGLGHVKEVLSMDASCVAIWILSDLSYDIANQDFYDWLKERMNSNKNVLCYILYTKGSAAMGRTKKINRLKSAYGDRVKIFPLDNISTHYIWSKSYGIIFLENIDKQPDVYISLGESDNTFYKKVIVNEEEASTLLGRLNNIAGIEN